jgi:hypothetical protein
MLFAEAMKMMGGGGGGGMPGESSMRRTGRVSDCRHEPVDEDDGRGKIARGHRLTRAKGIELPRRVHDHVTQVDAHHTIWFPLTGERQVFDHMAVLDWCS